MLVCISCGVAVIPSEVSTHISNQHRESRIQVNATKLLEACQMMDVVDEFPNMGYGPMDEIHGLCLQSGLLCLLCQKPYGTTGSMKAHHRECHADSPTPTQWPKVSVQQLNKGSKKSYFHVLPKASAPELTSDIIIQNLRSEQASSADAGPLELTDLRLISPWLRTTRWNELIQDKDIEILRDLVRPVTETEFPGLVQSIHEVFEGSTELLEIMPELFLQRLNTADPAK
jgi:hypothetical protein